MSPLYPEDRWLRYGTHKRVRGVLEGQYIDVPLTTDCNLSIYSLKTMRPAEIWLLILVVGSSLVHVAHTRCSYKVKNGQLTVRCRYEKHLPSSILQNVTEIDLNGCIIKSLSRKYLSQFSQLRTLLIHGCRLQTMDIDTFDGNLQLQALDISKNPTLSSTAMTRTICRLAGFNLNLTELNLSEMRMTSDEFAAILPCLETAHLSMLDLSSNRFTPLKDYTFRKMQSLEDLRLGNLPRLNLRALANLSRLNTLRLQNNKLVEIPNFYDSSTNESLLPNLRALYLDYNNIRNLPTTPVGLDKLQFLNLRGNLLTNITSREISVLSPKLDTLFLNTNRHLRLDQSSFSTTLKRLELRDCGLYFNSRVRNVFHNLKAMVGLSVSMNDFDYRNDKVFGILFHGMLNLEYLSVEHSRIKSIPRMTFDGLFNLKKLTLNDNRIMTLVPGVFRDLRSLNKLSLAGNSLSVVQEALLGGLIPPLYELNLSRNPFVCDCDLLWFLSLIRGHNVQLININIKDAYKCNSPPELTGFNLTSFKLTTADCKHIPIGIKLTIILTSTLLIISIAVTLVYRFRWYIGYLYFVLRAKRREARERDDTTPYEYDAFVVYNLHDLVWVRDKLLPVLEGEAHLRLCIHDRDWPCGRDICDNIVQSIAGSRKTLLVVSNSFAVSQWCHLEMALAQHRLLAADRNALVLVLLERLHRRNLTPRLLLQMQQQTYLEWTEDPSRQRLFWKKLRRSLQKPVDSFVRSSSPGDTAVSLTEY
ncbi:hypothetical protein LSH36_82g03055 [Paralvinella palmiformis]|uniref:TIR domain-containing protein n=1 Tax=Paralvinella palmiformis TaxID=53620 RepID=A0AAD9K208_9ANNE|nr:hypothetical protein LSH36_82g03055 [Paralvinella palmiformis]